MRGLMIGIIALLLCAPAAGAARMPVHEAAESPEYGRKFGGMLGRGLINVATCFVDVLVNVVNETRNGPPLVGTLVGVGKGLGCGTLRILSGAVDVTTFWVPGFNGFPVSDSYDNCFEVEPAAPGSGWSGSSMEPTGYTDVESEPQRPGSVPSTAAPESTKDKPRYSK